MVQLRDLPYRKRFVLNGKKYTQFLRPKRPIDPNDFEVVCYQPPQGPYEDIHCLTEVKPIFKA